MKLKDAKYEIKTVFLLKCVKVYRIGGAPIPAAIFQWGENGHTKTQALILANFFCDQWNKGQH